MWIPSKVPKSRQKFRPVAKESKTYGRKKPNGGNNMSVISMKQLLEAGVHFGHQTRRWNPKRLHTSTQREMVSTSSTCRNL